jgi:hypothetical protein
MNLNAQIRQQLTAQLSSSADDQASLNSALRLLSKWRPVLIQNTLLQQQGTLVMQGPLAGLDFLPQSAEGCHIVKLLGYYAVGMAKRMPGTHVLAHDINPKAQEISAALAQKNGVSNRVTIGGLFTPADFAAHKGKDVLLMCYIEGAERELLNPESAPAIKSMDINVENHECLIPGITQVLIDRFKVTHQITLVLDDGQRQLVTPPQWFVNLAHLDQLLATWEWRSGPTPWLVMMPKSAG